MKTNDCHHPDFAWCKHCEPEAWVARQVPEDKK